jgi:hypothetical protein
MNEVRQIPMAEAREKPFSTSLTAEVGARVKTIASSENRSFANVIESAVKVFTLLPKDIRDVLVDAAGDEGVGRKLLKELARVMMYQVAVRRLDAAAEAAAAHLRVEPEADDYDDAVVESRR